MTNKIVLAILIGLTLKGSSVIAEDGNAPKVHLTAPELERNFKSPPDWSKPSGYWWWFNSLVDKQGITRDLEEFKAKGMGSVMLICSGNGYGAKPMPRGPVFLSPEWRELYKHAVNECARLGLELTVNFSGGGWCMGGSWIKPEYSARWYVQSTTNVAGPRKFSSPLQVPGHRAGYEPPFFGNVNHYKDWPKEKADYRDTAVVAFREDAQGGSDLGQERRTQLAAKSNRKDANCMMRASEVIPPTLVPWTSLPGDKPIAPAEVIDLTGKLKPDGTLEWEIPEGNWTIQRIGHVCIGCDVRCILPEGDPKSWLEVDWLNPDAVDEMFTHLGQILIEDAGPHVGKTFKLLHTDSFEDGFPNWTGRILDQFKKYRGYDPTPYLPVFAGKIIGSAEISDRFLYDYRKTVADCMADGNYGHFAKRARQYGLDIQCEAAGPSWSMTMCMDGLKNLGRCGYPMGEIWQGALYEDGQSKVGKQAATAAHIYGRRAASAEALTGGGHWVGGPTTLKPWLDIAFCEGINRCVFHTMTCTRPQDGLPGYEYGCGQHFNPNVTWWQQAAGSWLGYVNRCQTLLQSGRFVADVLYYNGDWAPNLVDAKRIAPALGNGYDYDVCNAEVLLTRLTFENGRLTLPDGMSYRVLVLPESRKMPVEVVEKIKTLVEAGATVLGPRPESDPGLKDYPRCDERLRQTANSLWGDVDGKNITERKVGKGRIIWGKTSREVLVGDRILPDFEVVGRTEKFIEKKESTKYRSLASSSKMPVTSDTITRRYIEISIDFIHRATPDTDLYFIVNRQRTPDKFNAIFRVSGKQPELWDPMSGTCRPLREYRPTPDGRIEVPLEIAGEDSIFVVFRSGTRTTPSSISTNTRNFPVLVPVKELTGSWQVSFDPRWFYPTSGMSGDATSGKMTFDKLCDWRMRPEPAVKHFSGTAVYRKSFDLKKSQNAGQIFLDLGLVKDTAKVRLNGQELGVLWRQPWRVEISAALKDGENDLEIEVVNGWPNRLIGDAGLPENERRTRTNIPFKFADKLLPSGLLGPVTISASAVQP